MTVISCSGALFFAKNTGRYLFLQKARGRHSGTWGVVGGTNIDNENPWQGLQREVVEEISFMPTVLKSVPLETFVSNDSVFKFHTFLCVIEDEFVPRLSDEHIGWAWATLENAPEPLHHGLRSSFANNAVMQKVQTLLGLLNS